MLYRQAARKMFDIVEINRIFLFCLLTVTISQCTEENMKKLEKDESVPEENNEVQINVVFSGKSLRRAY